MHSCFHLYSFHVKKSSFNHKIYFSERTSLKKTIHNDKRHNQILTNKTALPETASRDNVDHLVKEALVNKFLY